MNKIKTLVSLGMILLPFAIIFFCMIQARRKLMNERRRNAARLADFHATCFRAQGERHTKK